MRYPLAMLLLALMDQRARKEAGGPGATAAKQERTEDRGLADGDGDGGKEGGDGYGGH